MLLKKEFDLIKNDNVVYLNKKDLMNHSINVDNMKKIIYMYQNEHTKITNPILGAINKIMNERVLPNFKKGLSFFDSIHFVNLDKNGLPAYYNPIEKNLVCNFIKPVHYLSIDDIVANILYAYSYKSVLKIKQYNRNLLKEFGGFFSTIVLNTFGKKEGVMGSLKNVGILTLVTYKFIDKQLFNNEQDLASYISFIDNKFVKQELDIEEIRYLEKYINVDRFKDYVESLNKIDIIQRIDYKAFVSILYNRYQRNENIISLFDTYERIIPFILIMNFPNIINSGFALIFKENDRKIYNLTKYGVSLLSMVL